MDKLIAKSSSSADLLNNKKNKHYHVLQVSWITSNTYSIEVDEDR